MAKKKKVSGIGLVLESRGPTQEERIRWSAEAVARDMVEQSPVVKKMRDAITEAVQKAAKRAVKDLGRNR